MCCIYRKQVSCAHAILRLSVTHLPWAWFWRWIHRLASLCSPHDLLWSFDIVFGLSQLAASMEASCPRNSNLQHPQSALLRASRIISQTELNHVETRPQTWQALEKNRLLLVENTENILTTTFLSQCLRYHCSGFHNESSGSPYAFQIMNSERLTIPRTS